MDGNGAPTANFRVHLCPKCGELYCSAWQTPTPGSFSVAGLRNTLCLACHARWEHYQQLHRKVQAIRQTKRVK